MSMPLTQRLVFGETLVALGGECPALVVLDADVCSSTQTRLFAQAYPERFFNFGIAEANMMSAAAGMASCGLVPVVSTFALFIALRASDQLRAQIAYPSLNVTLAGGYAGLSDFADGASHQAIEDIAIMRAIPNIVVIAPADITETRMAVRAAIAHDGPVYLRLSRDTITQIFDETQPFAIGKGIVLRDGSDATIISTGTMLNLACAAADALASRGLQARVIDMHTIKPIDADLVVDSARHTGAIVTVEEHSIIGGLGSAVCELVCHTKPVPVLRCGVPDRFGESGAYGDILRRAGLDVPSIAQAVEQAITLKNKR